MKLAAEIARLAERVFGVDHAETAPELRRAAAARAELVTGLSAAAPDLAVEWQKYVDKVALHAYKITDQDVQALRQAGHGEDAIFEVTVATAIGASLARARRALDLLKGSC